MQNKVKLSYTDHQSHSCCADKNPYRHDSCADKETYQHEGRAYILSRIGGHVTLLLRRWELMSYIRRQFLIWRTST